MAEISPFVEANFGWPYGSSGWNTDMDQNLVKFSYLHDRNIDGIVATLPAISNGTAYFLTTDNRLYFDADGQRYSSPTPKWFIVTLKSSGQTYQFDGSALNAIDTPVVTDGRLDAVEVVVGGLSDSSDVAKGDALVVVKQPFTGAVARTQHDKNTDVLSVKDFGAVGDGITDDTVAIQAAINASQNKSLLVPNGTFIASVLSIPHSMQFFGLGEGSSLKQKSATNNFFIQPSSDGVSVAFNSLTLDQNNSGQTTGSGKFLFNTDKNGTASSPHIVTFNQVTLKDFCEGALRIVGDRSTSTREVMRVINCKFIGGTESESSVYDTFTIFAADASELTVVDCDFDHNLTLTKQGIPAISVAGTVVPSEEYTELTVRNNRFRNYGRFTSGSGIGVIDAYVWADKVDISGNKFIGSYVVPIRGKCNARDVVIHGNIMSGFNNPGTASLNGGISFVSATLPPTIGRFIISDNIIDTPLYRGIEVSDSGSNPESIIISNNIVLSPGDIGINLVGCSGFSVEGNSIKNAAQQGIAFASCVGIGRIDSNIINTTAQTGIQALGSQLTLDIQIHGNFILAATASGVTCENVRMLSLQENVVKDVTVLTGNQRGYRVGGSTGIEVGQVKNNLALGTFATAEFSVITNGFTAALYEYGNSWNYQERWLAAAPVTGAWIRGDRVWNTAPSAGGNIGWVCTTSGTPGTWKTFGTIQA